MTIEEAVIILDKAQYAGRFWIIDQPGGESTLRWALGELIQLGGGGQAIFTEFEVIAIAEKLEKDSQRSVH